MKKFLVCLSVFLFPIVVASCSNSKEVEETKTPSETSGYTATPVKIDKNDSVFEIVNSMGGTLKITNQSEIAMDSDLYNNENYPLIALSEEKDIYIYEDKNKGIIYVEGDYAQYFPIGNVMTSIMIYPQMFTDDFDGDGDEEVAIIFNTNAETGYYLEELYIFDSDEKGDIPIFNANAVTNIEYGDALDSLVGHSKNDNRMTLVVDGVEHQVQMANNVTDLSYGKIVYFAVYGDKITMNVPLGFIQENIPNAQYENMGEIIFDIFYDGEKFAIEKPEYIFVNRE